MDGDAAERAHGVDLDLALGPEEASSIADLAAALRIEGRRVEHDLDLVAFGNALGGFAIREEERDSYF